MASLGILTLGQAPRSDVVPSMRRHLPPGTRILEAGALDGLMAREAAAFRPEDGERVLTTRMLDGRSIAVSKERLMARLERAFERLLGMGAEAVLLLCTGDFPELRHRALVAEPDRLLRHAVEAFAPSSLGVVVPLPEQVEWGRDRWSGVSSPLTVVSADPYGPPAGVAQAAASLAKASPALVVMDCMGFREDHCRIVRHRVDVPTVLANSAVSRLLAEVLE